MACHDYTTSNRTSFDLLLVLLIGENILVLIWNLCVLFLFAGHWELSVARNWLVERSILIEKKKEGWMINQLC